MWLPLTSLTQGATNLIPIRVTADQFVYRANWTRTTGWRFARKDR